MAEKASAIFISEILKFIKHGHLNMNQNVQSVVIFSGL